MRKVCPNRWLEESGQSFRGTDACCQPPPCLLSSDRFMAETPIPNFDWYSSESKRLNLPPRCPFASVETCPRYYESLSLMGKAGATSLASERDNELLARWKRHPLWPATDEQAASVVGNPRAPALSNFCPEVIYNIFHYFATGLARHYDEFDAESAHKRLRAEGATRDDPRWTYSYIEAQHYSECPLYSPLAHGNLVTSGTNMMFLYLMRVRTRKNS